MLTRYGKVSRNQALRMNITRLAARIRDLKDEGMKIKGTRWETKKGRDHLYVLEV